jgi:hypothetical protein
MQKLCTLIDTVADIYIWMGDNNNNNCPNLKCQNLNFEIKFLIFKPVSYPFISLFLCINTTKMRSIINICQLLPVFLYLSRPSEFSYSLFYSKSVTFEALFPIPLFLMNYIVSSTLNINTKLKELLSRPQRVGSYFVPGWDHLWPKPAFLIT